MGNRVTWSGGEDFVPAPDGVWPAVLVDVIDMGLWDTMDGQRQKFKLVFEIAEKMNDGRPYVVSAIYTASLYERALLRPAVEALLGRPLTEQETRDFDLDTLIGNPCEVNIEHTVSRKDGKTYANVKNVMKVRKGAAPFVASGNYKRKEPRDQQQRGTQRPAGRPAQQQAPARVAEPLRDSKPADLPKNLFTAMSGASSEDECNYFFNQGKLALREGHLSRDELVELGQVSQARKLQLAAEAVANKSVDDDIPF